MSCVNAGLFDGLFGEKQQNNVVEIDHIKFNTTNETKFKLYNETNGTGWSVKHYIDENETGFNVGIFNYSGLDKSTSQNNLKTAKAQLYNNYPSETVNGVVIYTTSENHGKHVGEPRYGAIIENYDLQSLVIFSTPNPNETAKMALSIKFN